jgi:hypothetical protein
VALNGSMKLCHERFGQRRLLPEVQLLFQKARLMNITSLFAELCREEGTHAKRA